MHWREGVGLGEDVLRFGEVHRLGDVELAYVRGRALKRQHGTVWGGRCKAYNVQRVLSLPLLAAQERPLEPSHDVFQRHLQ